MKRVTKKPEVFNYLDYRIFLNDWYDYKKEHGRGFSFRSFSKSAGFSSHTVLRMVMMGSRNLSEDSISKFASALSLNKEQTSFFKNLVLYSQSKGTVQENIYYKNIMKARKYSLLKPLDNDQYEFYSKWYHPAVRELLSLKGCDGSPEWISKNICPSITVAQAKDSLELLERLHFIIKVKGRWRQVDPIMTTGNEATSLMTLNYHQEILQMISGQIKNIAPEERDISAINCGVPRRLVPKIKKRIQEFSNELMQLVATEDDPEESILFAMQMMPTSRLSSK